MTTHARLSPSSAHRWMNCPGSVELCKDIPHTSSAYADEGTAAHRLAEGCLRSGMDAIQNLGISIAIDDRVIVVTEEMADAVQLYVDTVRGDGYNFDVEQKIDLSWVSGLDGGTVDAVTRAAHIIDLKYGSGVAVEVQDNPQLMLYALGVFGVGHSVRTTIVQPRCPHPDGPVRSAGYSASELLDFGIRVAEAAEATMQSEAPLHPGNWCRFCPARATCPALRAYIMVTGGEVFGALVPPEPRTLPPEHLADLLGKARLLKTWMKAIEEHAHAEALAGRAPPGFKLVANRAIRKWAVVPDDVLNVVSEFGFTSDDIYETTLISPAAMDRLLKKNKKAIVPLVTKVSSGTILVEESDPRPPARIGAAEVFQIESEGDENG